MKKLKILEISPFTAGICGVGIRALSESKLLAKKGHEVYVFSSNIFRGEKGKLAEPEETIEQVKIKRFRTKSSFGENTFFWDYKKEALKLKPDIIITHAYRQYYSTKALKISKKLNIPCLIVTHAPFLEKKLRGWKQNIAVFLYDNFIGKRILRKYNKIIVITQWEVPHILKLGCEKDKIEYIPNGIPEIFFKKKTKKGEGILFLGKMTEIKDIEILISAVHLSKTQTKISLVGPCEGEYKERLYNLVKKLNLKNIKFYPAVFDLKKKLDLIDSHEIFILPSKREAMPQALIEAMARKKIAVSSNTQGGKEIIKDNFSGFLFKRGDSEDLSRVLTEVQSMNDIKKDKIRQNARNSVIQFSWESLIEKLEKLILESIKNHNKKGYNAFL